MRSHADAARRGRIDVRDAAARARLDRLELDRSSLATPSRIESIAVSWQMRKAPALRYIAMPSGTTSPARQRAGGGRALAQVIGAAASVTTREASVLLVGDAGLAATR